LRNPTSSGAPLTLLAVASRNGWVQVLLPTRPNGSSGWVREAAVVRSIVVDALEVSTAAHQVQHYRRGKLVATYAAATGTGGTPTPRGEFYITALLQPTNSGYGPYAYGLSAHSEVLHSFGGGNGQIGLHGTDQPGTIGRSASHGCVRLSTAAIRALAAALPLGTPVTIS
jgi:lipoprotein-anchoring transpeptidase ErfK/SrfK